MASPSRDSALDSDREIDSEDELIDYERMDAAPTTRTTETTRAVEDGEIEDARADRPRAPSIVARSRWTTPRARSSPRKISRAPNTCDDR